MRLYVGRFAGGHEEDIRAHLARYKAPPVEVIDLEQIVDRLIEQAKSGTYIDDPVLVTVKALDAAGRLSRRDPQ
jgi:hypothetical protein